MRKKRKRVKSVHSIKGSKKAGSHVISRACNKCSFKVVSGECGGKLHTCKDYVFFKNNCLFCCNYNDCELLGKNPNKDFVCSNFEKDSKKTIKKLQAKQNKKSKPKVIEKGLGIFDRTVSLEEFENMNSVEIEDHFGEDFNPSALVEKVIGLNYNQELFESINERDIPFAQNPVHFILDKNFLNFKLFPRQLQVCLEYFSSFCPECSDTEFLRNGIEVDTKLGNILDKAQLYVDGKCLKCGRTRYDNFRDHHHRFYTHMIGLVGQRAGKCLEKNTILPTDKGFLKIGEINPNANFGWSNIQDKNISITTDTDTIKVTKLYKEKPNKLIRVILKNGYKEEGTFNHPIYTNKGFVKLKDLTTEYYVPIYYGQDIWSKIIPTLETYVSKAEKKFNSYCNSLNTLNRNNIIHYKFKYKGKLNKSIARFLGYFVSEGSYRGISNTNLAVLNDCFNTLSKLIGRRYCIQRPGCVMWKGSKFLFLLEELLNIKRIKSGNQEIPYVIRNSPKSIVIEFLRALYEGDGGFNKHVVEYCSISKKLVYQLSSILHNIGIIHKIIIGDAWATNGSVKQISKKRYSIYIEGSQLEVFKTEIGFISKRKSDRLDIEIYKFKNRTLNMPFWFEKCPVWLKNDFLIFLDKIKQNLNLHKNSNTGKKYGLQTVYSSKGIDKLKRLRASNVSLSKPKILFFTDSLLKKDIIEKLDKELIVELFEYRDFALSKMYYSKVDMLKLSTNEHITYDINVPNQHKFIANGILNHNSALCAIMCATITHFYLKIPNAGDFFGLLRSVSTLHGTFVGLRYADAYNNLFEPYSNILSSAPWYKMYHKFLHDEGLKLSVELLKFKSTFITYNHKNIAVAPSGPDKRKLRGLCSLKSTLINNSNGLIRINNKPLNIGATTYKGKNKRKITNVIKQEHKKEIIKATLANGMELDVTPDHRVLTLCKNGESKWVHQEDLLGCYVFCQLGGDFPKELYFDYKIKKHTPYYVKIAKYVSSGEDFTINELAEKYNLHKNSVLSYHLGPMIKAGVFIRKSRRDSLGHPLPSIYKINSKFDLNDWNNLRPGDVNNNRSKLKLPKLMTPKLARFIGYLIADGDLNHTHSIEFCTTSKDKYKDFNKLFKHLFSCDINIIKDNREMYGENKDQPIFRSAFSYGKIKEFFKYLGLSNVNAHAKTLPWCILQANKECAIECLSTMISFDGGIRHNRFYYSSVSRKLAITTQLLLMKLGYVTILRTDKNGAHNLFLTVKDSLNFLKVYTGLHKRDWKKDAIFNFYYNEESCDLYKVPFTRFYTLNEINRKFGVVGKATVSKFKKYIDKNIIFSRVVKLENLGKKEVYDLSVDAKDSTFPANGVLVHNTRCFCLSGDTLIDTSNGLVKFKKLKTGLTTFKGNRERKIVNVKQGDFRKDMVTVTLSNGLTIKSTKDHKFIVLKKSYKHNWKEAKDLTGYYIPLSFNTIFPTKKEIVYNKKMTFLEVGLRYIYKTKVFNLETLTNSVSDTCNKKYKGATALTSMLRKDGILSRKKQGKYGCMEYTLNPKTTPRELRTYLYDRVSNIKYPKYTSYKLGWILGCFVTDGAYRSDHEFTYSSGNFNKIKRFIRYIKKLFNVSLNYGCYDTIKKSDSQYVVRIGVRELKDFFRHIGLGKEIATTKEVPWIVLEGCKKIAKGYIVSSILHDGGISQKGIRYNSHSKQLLQQFALLSLKLGFLCTVRKNTLIYEVDESLLLQKWIIKTKIDKYQHIKTFGKPLIRKRNLNKYFATPYHKDNQSYPVMYNNREGLKASYNRNISSKVLHFVEKVNPNWVYIEVVSVENSEPEIVYDLTVDSKDCTFTANGMNVHNSSVDEISWFVGKDDEIRNIDEVYQALDNSLMTLIPKAKKMVKKHPWLVAPASINISSPRSKTDKGMRMFKLSQMSRNVYGIKGPTWWFNPEISRRDLADKYLDDPVKAERDFGANPPYGENTYISSPATLVPLFTSKRNVINTVKTHVVKGSLNTRLCYQKIKFKKIHSYPSVLAIDCGYNNNSFCCVLMHNYLNKSNDNVIACSGIIELVPEPYALSYPHIYEHVISKIIKQFNIKLVIFDRWQSLNLSQSIFKDHNIDALLYSPKKLDFENLKSCIYAEEIIFPRLESPLSDLLALKDEVSYVILNKPSNHLFLQLLLSVDNGRTITKGEEMTDDILRALILGYYALTDEEYKDMFLGSGSEKSLYYSNIDSIIKTSQSIKTQTLQQGNSGVRSAQGVGASGVRGIGFNNNNI